MAQISSADHNHTGFYPPLLPLSLPINLMRCNKRNPSVPRCTSATFTVVFPTAVPPIFPVSSDFILDISVKIMSQGALAARHGESGVRGREWAGRDVEVFVWEGGVKSGERR
ncbi:hypothetical protein ATANTOWER_006022 [Ataeniobius toweri]|uniref:Uncharacterized protein n=1 Tax=Ataeniobius toweri TaxID=208326 RepID=A0ABU7B698_9TELE|nr:hypothetical protein [Ataeniobius toweri]